MGGASSKHEELERLAELERKRLEEKQPDAAEAARQAAIVRQEDAKIDEVAPLCVVIEALFIEWREDKWSEADNILRRMAESAGFEKMFPAASKPAKALLDMINDAVVPAKGYGIIFFEEKFALGGRKYVKVYCGPTRSLQSRCGRMRNLMGFSISREALLKLLPKIIAYGDMKLPLFAAAPAMPKEI